MRLESIKSLVPSTRPACTHCHTMRSKKHRKASTPQRAGPCSARCGRDLAVQVVAQKPQPVEPKRNRVHQLPLRAHVVENQKKHHLEDRRRRNGDIALDPVAVLNSS